LAAGLYCRRVALDWDLAVMTIRQAAAIDTAIKATTTEHT
jgi:hypothetical protein